MKQNLLLCSIFYCRDRLHRHAQTHTHTLLIVKHKNLWCNKTCPSDQQRFLHVKKKSEDKAWTSQNWLHNKCAISLLCFQIIKLLLVTHAGCTAYMLIQLPSFTSYCSKCTEFHYISFSAWQTVSCNFDIRCWKVTLTLYFLFFTQGVKSFQEVGHITLSDIESTITCFRTSFISGYIITQKYLNGMVQKCVILWLCYQT